MSLIYILKMDIDSEDNIRNIKDNANKPERKIYIDKPQKSSFEEKKWEEPEEMAKIAPINKNVHIDVTKLHKATGAHIIEENYGIEDPELLQFYNSLNEKQRQIVRKMPSQEDKIRFLKFTKNYRTKKNDKPIIEFLKKKKFSPVEQNEIVSEWNFAEDTNKELLKQQNIKYSPPEWLKDKTLLKPTLGELDIPDSETIFGKDIEEEEIEEETKKKLSAPQIRFAELVDLFYSSNPFNHDKQNLELEVRFGTRGVQPLTKNDYDNVIKKLKSSGFKTSDQNGLYSLRIQNEFIEPNSGKIMISPIRTEIEGLQNIQNYCNNNNISEIIKSSGTVKFIKKTNIFDKKNEKIWPINFDDFNFRVSYQSEEVLRPNKGAAYYIVDKWKESKKTFRYLNRVTFTNPNYPIFVDISIVKSSEFNKTFYSTEDSKIFTRPEVYEIELEVDNKRTGPGTPFNNSNVILQAIKKVIKLVLSGLQGTNYPISYPEQKNTINSYMELLYKDNFDHKKWVNSSNFIGPNSITLQLNNIGPIDENSVEPNIRDNYVVTDKADGDRHLMYINNKGNIYLINTNMNVIFTGAKTVEKEYFNSILDGELIYHDKVGKFINLYAAFDIYYFNKYQKPHINL